MMGAFFSLTVLADSKPTAREEMNQEYKKGIGGKRYEIERSPIGSFDYYMEKLDATKKKLNITKEQQALWSDYEKSLITFFSDLKRAKARVGGTTAVQQVGQVLGVTQNRYAGMEQVYDSAKKLYEGLSDSQKKTADEILITTVPSFD
jgi:DNA-binding transcriptional regulator YbjK